MKQSLFINLTTILCAALLLSSLPAAAAAKPKPVDGLLEMFNEFNELEDAFRENEWDEALKAIKKIEEKYKEMIPKLKSDVDEKVLHKFSFILGSFKKASQKKDSEEVEKPFVMLQKLFIEIMGNYDYPSPPGMIVMNLWINEAKEYLEKGNMKGVEEEMEEIDELKETIEASLNQDQAEKLEELCEIAEKIEKLADDKDAEAIEKALSEMKGIVGQFIDGDAAEDDD